MFKLPIFSFIMPLISEWNLAYTVAYGGGGRWDAISPNIAFNDGLLFQNNRSKQCF